MSSTCPQCRDLAESRTIRVPADLSKAIHAIHSHLDSKNLIAIGDDGSPAVFDQVDAGPWPDLILSKFRCLGCEREFELSVETYHGAGGSWSTVENKAT